MKKIAIGVIIIIGILIILGFVGFYFLKNTYPTYLIGDETLEVVVTMDNGIPLGQIEVDLWKSGSSGAPNAGINYTNEEGVVIFKIPEGEYEIGFNLNNFPGNLVYPEKTFVIVEKNMPSSKTILIKAEHE
jgi:hypothetical protein